jgi:hypothetical protein
VALRPRLWPGVLWTRGAVSRYDAVREVSRIPHPGGALDTPRSESQQAPVTKTAVRVCLGPRHASLYLIYR